MREELGRINRMGCSRNQMLLGVPEREEWSWESKQGAGGEEGRRGSEGRKSQPWSSHCLFPSC